jgi:hypothetical protein
MWPIYLIQIMHIIKRSINQIRAKIGKTTINRIILGSLNFISTKMIMRTWTRGNINKMTKWTTKKTNSKCHQIDNMMMIIIQIKMIIIKVINNIQVTHMLMTIYVIIYLIKVNWTTSIQIIALLPNRTSIRFMCIMLTLKWQQTKLLNNLGIVDKL